MTIRTSTRSVTFRRPFFINGIDRQMPAGTYVVETDEKLLENVSFLAYQRVSTAIHLPPKAGYSTTLTVDPYELDAALERDRAPAKTPVGQDVSREALKRATDLRREEADISAIHRAEDDGMIIHPR